MDPRIVRAQHLLDVDRPQEAAAALTELLAEEPEHPEALALLAFASLEAGAVAEALEQARTAVRVAPDNALPWLALGHAALRAKDRGRALGAAERVIELAPDEAVGFGLLAAVHVTKKRWREALEAADRGLEQDPEDDQCTHLRVTALQHLGQLEEARAAMGEQLRRTPDDAWAHANQGWTVLRDGDHRTAREHFREALRLDPSLEAARVGLREALLAGHWFYRPVLRWFLWMGGLDGRRQLLVIVGGYVLYRLALGQARGDGALQPLWVVLVAGYLVLAASTWFAQPLASGFLMFTVDGRRVLLPRERAGAALVCALLVAGVALLAAGALFGAGDGPTLSGVLALGLALPTKMIFELESAPARRWMSVYTAACALFAVVLFVGATVRDRESQELRRDMAPFVARIEAYAERVERAGQEPSGAAPVLPSTVDPELRAEREAIERDLEATGLRDRMEADRQRSGLRGYGIVFGVLCFWVSQFVAATLSRRYDDD